VAPPPGRLGFSSQSGAMGIAVMDRAAELGLGISSFVSVGNKADISGILLRLSALVEDLPALAEIDLNPVIVSETGRGCMVVDARMRIARPKPSAPRGARTSVVY
jgi:acyl-CoA synthetase (NDP forming)